MGPPYGKLPILFPYWGSLKIPLIFLKAMNSKVEIFQVPKVPNVEPSEFEKIRKDSASTFTLEEFQRSTFQKVGKMKSSEKWLDVKY